MPINKNFPNYKKSSTINAILGDISPNNRASRRHQAWNEKHQSQFNKKQKLAREYDAMKEDIQERVRRTQRLAHIRALERKVAKQTHA